MQPDWKQLLTHAVCLGGLLLACCSCSGGGPQTDPDPPDPQPQPQPWQAGLNSVSVAMHMIRRVLIGEDLPL